MQGINISENGHIVNVLPPIDITGGATGDRFTMKNYGHATIIVQVGVSAAAWTDVLVKECNAASGGTANAIGFSYYKEETAAGDTLSAKQTATATGIASPSANNNIFYVIELDGSELSDGYPWVEVSFTNGSNSVIASAVAILSGARYGNDQSDTAIV